MYTHAYVEPSAVAARRGKADAEECHVCFTRFFSSPAEPNTLTLVAESCWAPPASP
jgi:hypothetical protein